MKAIPVLYQGRNITAVNQPGKIMVYKMGDGYKKARDTALNGCF